MSAIQKKLPEFALELARGFTDLDWYSIDRPLTQLPFSRTKIPFSVPHAAVQIDDNVFLEQKKIAALKGNPGELPKLVLHELVRRIFLHAEGTNFQITESSVYKATELLSHAGDMSADELEAKLHELGFQTKNIPELPKAVHQKVSRLAIPNATLIDVPLSHPIPLKIARKVVQYCLNGNGPYSLLRDYIYSVAGNPSTYQWPEKKIWDQSENINFTNKIDGINYLAKRYEASEPSPTLTPGLVPLEIHADGSDCFDSLYADYSKQKLRFRRSTESRSGEDCEETYLKGLQNLDTSELDGIPDGGLPAIEFTGNPEEPVYSKFGLTNTDREIEHISVVASRTWIDGDGLVPIKNADTGVITPAKIHGKDYLNCLKSGFDDVAKEQARSAVPEVGDSKVIMQHATQIKQYWEPGDKFEFHGGMMGTPAD